MYSLSRPRLRPLLWLPLLAVVLLLTACGSRIANNNWAGMSTDGQTIYLAHGPEVIAVDAESRSLEWRYPLESQSAVQFYAAPSVDDGTVVFGDYGQSGGFLSPRVTVTIYSIDTSGAGLPQPLTNSEAASDKIVAPARQVDDRVYIGTADNHVLALTADGLNEIWDFETGHAIWGQPAYRDGVIYVASMDWSVYALDAESGQQIWQTTLGGALPSAPILGSELLYVSSYDGNVHALDIESGDVVWSAPGTNWVWGAPTLDNDTVYFGDIDGNLYAVDANTGQQIWQQATGAAIQSSPVVQDEVVYVASQVTGESPTGAITAHSAADGQRVWQSVTSAPLYTTPVIVGGDTIVVAQQNDAALLIGFDMANGQEVWRYALPQSE